MNPVFICSPTGNQLLYLYGSRFWLQKPLSHYRKPKEFRIPNFSEKQNMIQFLLSVTKNILVLSIVGLVQWAFLFWAHSTRWSLNVVRCSKINHVSIKWSTYYASWQKKKNDSMWISIVDGPGRTGSMINERGPQKNKKVWGLRGGEWALGRKFANIIALRIASKEERNKISGQSLLSYLIFLPPQPQLSRVGKTNRVVFKFTNKKKSNWI